MKVKVKLILLALSLSIIVTSCSSQGDESESDQNETSQRTEASQDNKEDGPKEGDEKKISRSYSFDTVQAPAKVDFGPEDGWSGQLSRGRLQTVNEGVEDGNGQKKENTKTYTYTYSGTVTYHEADAKEESESN